MMWHNICSAWFLDIRISTCWTCSACYIMIQFIEKAYDEVENNRPLMHAKIFYTTQGIYCARIK